MHIAAKSRCYKVMPRTLGLALIKDRAARPGLQALALNFSSVIYSIPECILTYLGYCVEIANIGFNNKGL